MISLTCCTLRDNCSLDPDRLLQKGEGTASSTLRVADLGSAGPARNTAVATTLELQLQRYVLKYCLWPPTVPATVTTTLGGSSSPQSECASVN